MAKAKKSGASAKKAAPAKKTVKKPAASAKPTKAAKPAKAVKPAKVAAKTAAKAIKPEKKPVHKLAAKAAAAKVSEPVEDTYEQSAPIETVEAPTAPAKASSRKRRVEVKIDLEGDLENQWRLLQDKYKEIKPKNYAMSEEFEAKTPLNHKTLGWGFILSSQNNRLEVLFKDGVKVLISNYKP